MGIRAKDGSAGDADYGEIGGSYTDFRRPEPEIEMVIVDALGSARTILNVGAGAGSYEPVDRDVTAVEPSASMREKRPAHLVCAVDARAEQLPFEDASFDAAMTTFSVHQWQDLTAGLREMRRVTRGPIVILTCDPALVRDFWLYEYAPEPLDAEARRYPRMDALRAVLGSRTRVTPVSIPLQCRDGFNEAYYGRPEMLLKSEARLACSSWSFVDTGITERFERRLGGELRDGIWDDKYGNLRKQATYEGSLVLVVSQPSGAFPTH